MCIRDRSTTLYGKSAVDERSFPPLSVKNDYDPTPYLSITDDLIDFNSEIWKMKKDQGLSLKSDISNITIPESLSSLKTSLRIMHSITIDD